MFLKMLIKCFWPWWLTAMALAEGEFPSTLRDPSLLRLLNNHPSSLDKARTQWSHEDTYRQASQGISHGYALHPQSHTYKITEPHSEYPTYSASSLSEHWSSANATVARGQAYSYSRPYSTGGTHHPLQFRPATALKKGLSHYYVGKYQIRNADGSPKNSLKTSLVYSPSIPASYKKLSHPKVHKPYTKHKYPIHKSGHPLYRKYYQSPYQKYAIPLASQSDYAPYKFSSTSPDGYHTTERMDDAYPDASDDYSHYNDTQYNAATNYYDAYEEPQKATLDPHPAAYDETTTRGYYGDRIYMSTHLPLQTPLEKSPTANTYFILRRTSDDEDLFD